MKILFSARPAFGHVYPMMPLALAARDAGHDVRFATTGRFLAVLDGLGFPTDDVGISIEEARRIVLEGISEDLMPTGAGGRPDLVMGLRLFVDVTATRTASELAPVLDRAAPDLVIYEQYELGAAVAAHAARIPAVCHALSPRTLPEIVRPFAADPVGRLWAASGVTSPAIDVFTGDAYLDIVPDVLQVPSFRTDPARVRLRPIPFTEPGAIAPPWLGRTSRPLVYLTLGTVVASDEVLLPAIRGLASLDVDVLVALGSADGAALGPLPSNVTVEAFVDQVAVLRHAALAVHHGGSGTILGALAAGVPQLLLPKGADQFENADLVTAAGIATVLEPAAAGDTAIAEAALASIGRLTPAADAARAELAAMPDPPAVVEQLVDRFGRSHSVAAA